MSNQTEHATGAEPPTRVHCSECGYTFPVGTVRLANGVILDPVVEAGGVDEHPCVRDAERCSEGLWQQMPGTFGPPRRP